MFDIFDVYLLEALVNGLLLGGVFGLLALGLNLVFGVIDVVWICYAELIMLGMYAMYFLYTGYAAPFPLAAVISIIGVGILGVLLHVLVIQPLLGTAPINQLLATGGVLFLLQSDPVDRKPAHFVRHGCGRLGQSGLWHAAGAVYHLSAAGLAGFGACRHRAGTPGTCDMSCRRAVGNPRR